MALADQIRRAATNGGGLHTDNVPQFPPDIQAPNRCKRAMGHFPLCIAKFSMHYNCVEQWVLCLASPELPQT